MKCADLDTALRAMKDRPGQPQKLTDERGSVVYSMYTDIGYELKTILGRALPFADGETRFALSFLKGAVTLEPIDETTYRLETR